MYIIHMKTIGEVAFSNRMKMSVGYRCDIPFDGVGLPLFSLGDLLRDSGIFIDAMIGAVHPVGYDGLVNAAKRLLETDPGCAPYIRQYYVNDRFIENKGYSIRSLKAGRDYFAYISFDKSKKNEIESQLAGITHLGLTEPGITGEVSMRLSQVSVSGSDFTLSPMCRYGILRYTLMLMTPLCAYSPYSEGVSTFTYIPGHMIKDALTKRTGEAITTDAKKLRCLNAYIAGDGKRLLPLPACVSEIKLDHGQLRYRLSPGKKPGHVEQDMNISEAYTDGVCERFIRYVRPETERIPVKDGEMLDALSPGQMFSGTIFGSDAAIRQIADRLKNDPIMNIGSLCENGFGEVYFRIDSVKVDYEEPQLLFAAFDICCASDTLIINEQGMPTCRAEDLLREIEIALGSVRKLKIIGKYMSIHTDHSEWRSAANCIAKGSILRLETIDKTPIDISPLKRCSIGERTLEGYGEVIAFPAVNSYYRIGEESASRRYAFEYRSSLSGLNEGARLTTEVLMKMLHDRIYGLAYVDRAEYAKGISAEELYPAEIAVEMKKIFDSSVSDDELKAWYLEGLEGTRDV